MSDYSNSLLLFVFLFATSSVVTSQDCSSITLDGTSPLETVQIYNNEFSVTDSRISYAIAPSAPTASFDQVSDSARRLPSGISNSTCSASCTITLSRYTDSSQGAESTVLYFDSDHSFYLPSHYIKDTNSSFVCAKSEGYCGANIPLYRYYRISVDGVYHAYSLNKTTTIDGYNQEYMPICYLWNLGNVAASPRPSCGSLNFDIPVAQLTDLNIFYNNGTGIESDHYYTTHKTGDAEVNGYSQIGTLGKVLTSSKNTECTCLVKLQQQVDNQTGYFQRLDHKLIINGAETNRPYEQYVNLNETVYCTKRLGDCGADVPLWKQFHFYDVDTLYSITSDPIPFAILYPQIPICYIWANNYVPVDLPPVNTNTNTNTNANADPGLTTSTVATVPTTQPISPTPAQFPPDVVTSSTASTEATAATAATGSTAPTPVETIATLAPLSFQGTTTGSPITIATLGTGTPSSDSSGSTPTTMSPIYPPSTSMSPIYPADHFTNAAVPDGSTTMSPIYPPSTPPTVGTPTTSVWSSMSPIFPADHFTNAAVPDGSTTMSPIYPPSTSMSPIYPADHFTNAAVPDGSTTMSPIYPPSTSMSPIYPPSTAMSPIYPPSTSMSPIYPADHFTNAAVPDGSTTMSPIYPPSTSMSPIYPADHFTNAAVSDGSTTMSPIYPPSTSMSPIYPADHFTNAAVPDGSTTMSPIYPPLTSMSPIYPADHFTNAAVPDGSTTMSPIYPPSTSPTASMSPIYPADHFTNAAVPDGSTTMSPIYPPSTPIPTASGTGATLDPLSTTGTTFPPGPAMVTGPLFYPNGIVATTATPPSQSPTDFSIIGGPLGTGSATMGPIIRADMSSPEPSPTQAIIKRDIHENNTATTTEAPKGVIWKAGDWVSTTWHNIFGGGHDDEPNVPPTTTATTSITPSVLTITTTTTSKPMGGLVGSLINSTGNVVNDTKNWFETQVAGPNSTITNFLNSTGTFFDQTVNNTKNATSSLWENSKDWIGDKVDSTGTALSGTWSDAKDFGSDLKNHSSGFIENSKDWIGDKMNSTGTALAGEWNDTKNFGSDLKNQSSGLLDNSKDWVKDKVNSTGAVLSNAWEDTKDFGSNLKNSSGTFLENSKDWIGDKVNSTSTSVGGVLSSLWDGTKDWVGDTANNAGNAIHGLMGGDHVPNNATSSTPSSISPISNLPGTPIPSVIQSGIPEPSPPSPPPNTNTNTNQATDTQWNGGLISGPIGG